MSIGRASSVAIVFFALVLVSILVRVALDGWLLPAIGPHIEQLLGGEFDHRNHLHSYGLIIVALIANCFWKPGLRRGVIPFAVTLGTTYLVVRFVLIEFTNFNVGSLQYMYEDVASSLLASPKSYIILITTAFLASWMNLRYSWDYNGILVPSLLALQWYNPYKILASFVEALVIFLLAKAVLKLPIWQRTTMEGGRKILLFFNVAFAYRLALGYIVPMLLPEVKVTDVFGFGYLLSTLLAIRAYEKGLLIRVARASLQVSLMGTVAGSLVGFCLTLLPGSYLRSTTASTPVAADPADVDRDIVSMLRRDKLEFYRHRLPGVLAPPSAAEFESFERGLRRLLRYRTTRQYDELIAARASLSRANYVVQVVQQRFLYLRERRPSRGWGLYVLSLDNVEGPVIEVPAPLSEWSTVEAGMCVLQQLDGSALAVAGTSRRSGLHRSADVLSNPLTIYGSFHKQLCRSNVVEVRGQTREFSRAVARSGLGREDGAPVVSSFWVKGSIPAGCRLESLRQLVGDWQLHWRTTPLKNVLRDNTRTGYSELVLTRADRRKLLAQLLASSTVSAPANHLQLVQTPIREWLFEWKDEISQRGTDQYRPASVEQLLYMDEQVIKPLLQLIHQRATFADLQPHEREELQALAAAAAVMDYRLIVFRDQQSQHDLVALAETDGGPRRHWGTYVFRFGLSGPHIISVPRPIYERNACEFAAMLFHRVPASAVLIAGAHPHTNLDGSADMIRWENKVNLFNLVHQVLVRESGPRAMMMASVRGSRAPVDPDVVVAMADGTAVAHEWTMLQEELISKLRKDGLEVQLTDGSPSTAGYEVGHNPQLGSLAHGENKEFATLWLSPSLRMSYRQQIEDRSQLAHFTALGIPTTEEDLFDYLEEFGCSQQCTIPVRLRTIVENYAFNRDIVRLRKVQVEFPSFRLKRLIDRASRQAFLLIEERGSARLPAIMRLSERTGNETVSTVSLPLAREQVQRFISSRGSWLEVESK